jgi:hypothetical protein
MACTRGQRNGQVKQKQREKKEVATGRTTPDKQVVRKRFENIL